MYIYDICSLLGVGIGIFPNSPIMLRILKYKITVLKKNGNVKIFNLILLYLKYFISF